MRSADEQRDEVRKVTGGLSPADLAGRLVDAIDTDRIVSLSPSPAEEDATAARLRDEALEPFNAPELRHLLIDLKRMSEVVIDHHSPDAVISTGFDEKAAQEMVSTFQRFLEEEKDQIAALSILYGKPQAQQRLTYQSLEELHAAMMRPPWLLQPPALWNAYRRLQGDKVRGNRTLPPVHLRGADRARQGQPRYFLAQGRQRHRPRQPPAPRRDRRRDRGEPGRSARKVP
ncbi:type I restriction-modification enzyme R subunit C-terminal domain-containing protein [Altererythrobacter fulvus]|uniref:type I restriction-modification enzyme R subunit C-terminal domain-containing protein n=1 Tax=Caenibius fulvus TaxID=2126012 RepID=UPI0030167B2D